MSTATTNPEAIKAQIIGRAHDLGFADCRVAAAEPAAHRALYEQWIADGKHGDMAWMARNLDRRTDPRIVVPDAQSVIVLAMNYYQGSHATHPSHSPLTSMP